MARPRILYITHELPFFPGGQGSHIREWGLLSSLSGSYDYSLVALHPAEDEHIRRLGTIGVKVLAVPRETGKWDRKFAESFVGLPYRVARYLWRRVFLSIPYLYPPISRRVLGIFQKTCRDLDLGAFDLVQVEHTYLLPIVHELKNIPACPPVQVTVHNVEGRLQERIIRVQRDALVRGNQRLAAGQMDRMEKRLIGEADGIVAVSAEDLRWIQGYVRDQGKLLAVVPNGVNCAYFRERVAETHSGTLVFTGALDYPPNTEAVFFFREEVLARVRVQVPEVRFVVAGRCSYQAKALMDGRDPAQESYHFNVPDIRPYLQQASVYVVPLRAGSGTRLKILEAMAAGKAVVSTTIGAEGLPVTPGENIVIADSPEAMALEIIRLLRSETERERIGGNAQAWVNENYDWSTVARKQDEVYRRMLGNKGL